MYTFSAANNNNAGVILARNMIVKWLTNSANPTYVLVKNKITEIKIQKVERSGLMCQLIKTGL